MNIKKIGIVGLFIALVVFSSMSVMAAEETSDVAEYEVENNVNPVKSYAKHTLAERLINWFMEKFDLTTEDTIGDLLLAIDDEQEDMKDHAKDKFGVETDEELKEAIKDQRIDHLRDALGLDESYTDEEVLEIAQEQRMDLVKEMLGLSEEATNEEVKEALQEWKEENKVLLDGPKARFKVWGWLFN